MKRKRNTDNYTDMDKYITKYEFPIESTSDGSSTLINMGNTCFLNSALQCLFHTEPLRDYFLSKKYLQDTHLESGAGLKYELGRQFIKLLIGMWEDECIVEPVSFYNTLTKCVHRFHGYQQHDSHECLVFILDLLHESIATDGSRVKISKNIYDISRKPYETWNKFLQHNKDSMITNEFYGLQQTLLKCLSCQTLFPKYDPYCYLSLSFPQDTLNERRVPITKLLDYYIHIEEMDGDNQYACEKCNAKTDAKKQQLLWSLPDILIIQLKRFEHMNKKINTQVDFPIDEFDLRDYVVPETRDLEQTKYRLYAVIYHYGVLGGGHYVAACEARNPQNGELRWLKFDDKDRSELSKESLVNPLAYVLFYRKIK